MTRLDEWPTAGELLTACRLLRAATSGGTADVFVYERDARKFLVKSFARHHFLARWFVGRPSIANEFRLLRELEAAGVQAIPHPYALLGRYTLVMEFIEGEQLLSPRHYAEQEKPPREFFLKLREIVYDFHRKGFAHGDFRRANLLIREGRMPCVIDWATATFCPPGVFSWRFLHRLLHRQQVKSDLYSLVKIIDDYYSDLISSRERRKGSPNWLLRFGRFLRYHLYRHGIKEWLGRTHHKKKP